MARLFEEFVLCGLSTGTVSGVRAAGPDRVIVTHGDRTVTVYKVSDQKPLGSWTVKQTQKISCPAVYNSQTGEYVVVHDHKVLRIWKDEDVNLEKTFKATLAADIYQIHTHPDTEPLVLFERGGVRQLDALLSAPQQEIESVLSKDEVIRWSDTLLEAGSPILLLVTEKDGMFHLYAQQLNPRVQHKFKLDSGEKNGRPLSFVLSLKQEGTVLTCLYSSGCIYMMQLSLNRNSVEKEQILPQSLLLKLPSCKDSLDHAAALILDEAHIAVLGAPHSLQCTVKDSLSIWNTRFQTLQAWKEFPDGSFGQLWCYSGKLFVPHGKVLTVIPFTCETSSLAAVLGKLKQPNATVKAISTIVDWNTLLVDKPPAEQQQTLEHTPTEAEPRRNLRSRSSQLVITQSQPVFLDQFLTDIKTDTNDKIDKKLKHVLSNLQKSSTQLNIAQIATILVSRCKTQVTFYPQKILVKLLQAKVLSYSLCPDLMAVALDNADYSLLQLCLQQFPDIPEAVTCACLKLFLSAKDSDLEKIIVDLGSVASYVKLDQSPSKAEEKMKIVENGCSPVFLEEDSCDVPAGKQQACDRAGSDVKPRCPVGLKKAALLNEILLSSYSEAFLLPPLKDLSVPQVVLFLRYLQYLYVKHCETVDANLPGKRIPTVNQVLDWISLLLDAHFTVLVMATEARGLIAHLHKFIRSQVKFYSELSKMEGSLQKLHEVKPPKSDGLYSIEVIEIF